jgi:hypothetical protein
VSQPLDACRLAGAAICWLALVAATTPAQSVIEAERAFGAKAQQEGFWTAFRATAAPDALMFVPGLWATYEVTGSTRFPHLKGFVETTVLSWNGRRHELAGKDLINYPDQK